MLSSYRVLDLADERGIFCGRVLGDLGADVIKVEPLTGDPARNVAPFHHDKRDHESSLFWQLYAINKRSLALDIEASDSRNALLNLVRSADFLIESFNPGYLESLDLGYDDLCKINPAIIYVSITAYGQTGPYRNYAATDLTGMALSGFMHLTGDEDRPPELLLALLARCLPTTSVYRQDAANMWMCPANKQQHVLYRTLLSTGI